MRDLSSLEERVCSGLKDDLTIQLPNLYYSHRLSQAWSHAYLPAFQPPTDNNGIVACRASTATDRKQKSSLSRTVSQHAQFSSLSPPKAVP
ncbi:Uncharacterized protein HZ326_16505 [Fusarium oxysporum f. sp. albedinis]|nr:Uncharacterized protein HZ326_16505 [Fusarium oxysporum f. sp. albedinis]